MADEWTHDFSNRISGKRYRVLDANGRQVIYVLQCNIHTGRVRSHQTDPYQYPPGKFVVVDGQLVTYNHVVPAPLRVVELSDGDPYHLFELADDPIIVRGHNDD